MNPVDRFNKWLGERLSWVFLAGVAFTSYEVVMRYFFNAPTVWVHETTIGLTATAFVIGGAYTLHRRDHIRISLVFDALPVGVRRWLQVLNLAVAMGYLTALGYGAYAQARKSIAVGETTGTASGLPLPMVLKSVLVFGVALMALQVLVQWWGYLRGRD